MLAVALVIAPLAGLACTPGEPHGQQRPVFSEGQDCAAYWQHDMDRSTVLDLVEDQGAGVVVQLVRSGPGCGMGEYGVVVMDCRSGEAVAVSEMGSLDPGYPFVDGQPMPFLDLREAIRQAAAAGTPIAVADVAARGRSAGLLVSEPFTTTSRISLEGHAFQLGCACRTAYPDLPGASQ